MNVSLKTVLASRSSLTDHVVPSNCLTYVFLLEPSTTHPNNLPANAFYKEVGTYLAKHTIAQADPALFRLP